MKRTVTIKLSLFIAFFIFTASSVLALKSIPARVIKIAGIVVNAQDLAPVESAQLFDGNAHLLGSTDKNGYYNISFNVDEPGEIRFELKVVKKGYLNFTQHEHWGNLGDTQNIMYFGLRASGAAKPFSSLAKGPVNDLSYENVLKGFDKVKKDREFDSKLESAKAGNENVLVQVDGKYYIVDSNGWIALKSDKDLVSIDNKQVVPADKLNATIKRKSVKGMTPVDSKEAKFLVFTK